MLTDSLNHWASADPDRVRFQYLGDDGSVQRFSNAQLLRRAKTIAAELMKRGDPGQRVLLAYPPGLDFVAGFFGCLYAGMPSVPVNYPKPRRPVARHAAIAHDCGATLALTTAQTLALLDVGGLSEIRWIATDTLDGDPPTEENAHKPGSDEIAFLQYTSGSTSEPKGVMVSHANLIHNLNVIHAGFRLADVPPQRRVVLNWLPAYHDMGLIGSLLAAFYYDGETIIMSPASFLQRPIRWLQAISEHRATISVAPCFAYELCAEKVTPTEIESLDLSCWYLAGCGAEPITAASMDRFAQAFAPCGFDPDAFYPCYGLAESTLMVTGGEGPRGLQTKTVNRSALAKRRVETVDESGADAIRVVGCGTTHCETEIAIVDPQTRHECQSKEVGEIWVRSGSVARGYWQRNELTQATFAAELVPTEGRQYLRTGDLGFVSDGELYVTGRLKDLIIIRGQNHYPQDIERTASDADLALSPAGGAAFSVIVDRQERLVIVHEIDRKQRDADLNNVMRSLRIAVAMEHELDVHEIVLIRQGSLPRTTSGKVRRFVCREKYASGEMKELARWKRSEARDTKIFPPIQLGQLPLAQPELERLSERIETALLTWLRQESGAAGDEIRIGRPFAEIGVDSLRAVELSRELEDWLGIELTPVLAWQYPTPRAMAGYLARKAGGLEEVELSIVDGPTTFERLLTEVEALPDSEVGSLLRGDCDDSD